MKFALGNSWLVKIFLFWLGAIFLIIMFLSLFYMSMGMDVSFEMSDCPLMLDQSIVCQMDVYEHISVWKSLFLSIAPNFVLFSLVLVSILLAFSQIPGYWRHPPEDFILLYRRVVGRLLTFNYRALQELFSNGILHPKLFNFS